MSNLLVAFLKGKRVPLKLALAPDFPSIRKDSAEPTTYPPLMDKGKVTLFDPDKQQGFYGQEQNALKRFISKTRGKITGHITEAEKAGAHGTSTFPSSDKISQLALLGSPAKGEYQRTAEYVHSMFGFHPHGEVAWHVTNAMLSPQTAYENHTKAASLFTAHWLMAGSPTDPNSIKQVIETVKNSPTGTGKEGLKGVQAAFSNSGRIERFVKAMSDLPNLVDAWKNPHMHMGKGGLGHISNEGLGKTANFALSYLHPELGAALDIHMMHPTFPNELEEFAQNSKMMRSLGVHFGPEDKASLKDIGQRAKSSEVRPELVKLIDKYSGSILPIPHIHFNSTTGKRTPVETSSPQWWMKDIKEGLIANPANYLAYKSLVREAARKLGWTLSEVQESAWTGIVALKAAQALNIPHKEVVEALDHDTIRKGWQNHESFLFPQLAGSGYARYLGGSTLKNIRAKIAADASASSRPGIVQTVDPSIIESLIGGLAGSRGIGAALPVKKALEEKLRKVKVSLGLRKNNPLANALRMARAGLALKMAMPSTHNMPLPWGQALQRATSSNFRLLATKLKDVLNQAGAANPMVLPAIHDIAGQYRSGVLAHADSPGREDSPAWIGMFAKQPGMVAFNASQSGPDRMYRFSHPDVNAIGQALNQAGISNRVIVPDEKTNHVYVYDQGEKLMPQMAQAVQALGVQADTWPGNGQQSGGHEKDMGRAQYRDQINRVESTQPQPTQMSLLRFLTKKSSRARTNCKFCYDHEASPSQLQLALQRRVLHFANPQGNDAVRANVADYVTRIGGPKYGIPPIQPHQRLQINPELSKATADAFERMPHTPNDPKVQQAYQQLIKEVTDQYNHLTQQGVKMEPWLQPGQPYKNSADMSADVGNNSHLWYYPTDNPHETGYGSDPAALDPSFNPMVAKTGHVVNGYETRANDLLRAVHDYYGHAKEGHEFGPEGELNAWAEHAKTLSPLAQQALTTETHGQNSWVNFGPHLRRPDGSIPKRGEVNWVPPQARPFAEQKAGILPPEVHPPHPYKPVAAPLAPATMSKSVPPQTHPMLGNYRHVRFRQADILKLSNYLRMSRQITHPEMSDLIWHMPGNQYAFESLPTQEHPQFNSFYDQLRFRDLHRVQSDKPFFYSFTSWAPRTDGVPGRVNWTMPHLAKAQTPYITRRLITFQNGRPVINNDYSFINPNSPYKGIAQYNLLRQLESAHAVGIPKVKAYMASSDKGAERKMYNGGLVWPLLGAEGYVDRRSLYNLPEETRKHLTNESGYTTHNIQDILAAPGGKEWWINNHHSIDGGWETDPDSRSFKILKQKVFDKMYPPPPPRPNYEPLYPHPEVAQPSPAKMEMVSPGSGLAYKLFTRLGELGSVNKRHEPYDPLHHFAMQDMVAHIVEHGYLHPRHGHLLDNL